MVESVGIRAAAAQMARAALRAFLTTSLSILLFGTLLAVVVYAMLRDHPWYAGLAVAVSVAEAVAVGVALGAKQALATAFVSGVRAFRLGEAVMRVLFGRVLGGTAAAVEQPATSGARGERIPLAEAEERLTRAADAFLGEGTAARGIGGWLQRRLRTRVVRSVEALTLARFRAEGETQGGVDLRQVQAHLEGRIDQALTDRVRAGLRLWTALAVVGLPAAVFVQTYLLLALLRAK